jgi:hypothetical protein
MLAIVELHYTTWGRRERKSESVSDIAIYSFSAGTGYNNMYGKLLNNGG